MTLLLRHLLSILLLPFIVVAVVPAWLLNSMSGATRWSTSPSLDGLLCLAGIALLGGGFGLFSWCVSLFARVGRGTLAPWDPTRTLVAIGPYRYVRNPMISGVAMMLLGEALLWGSLGLGLWACAFISINHIYFVLAEEPGLEKRFGASYRLYKTHVPRWIPRLKPWSGA